MTFPMIDTICRIIDTLLPSDLRDSDPSRLLRARLFTVFAGLGCVTNIIVTIFLYIQLGWHPVVFNGLAFITIGVLFIVAHVWIAETQHIAALHTAITQLLFTYVVMSIDRSVISWVYLWYIFFIVSGFLLCGRLWGSFLAGLSLLLGSLAMQQNRQNGFVLPEFQSFDQHLSGLILAVALSCLLSYLAIVVYEYLYLETQRRLEVQQQGTLLTSKMQDLAVLARDMSAVVEAPLRSVQRVLKQIETVQPYHEASFHQHLHQLEEDVNAISRMARLFGLLTQVEHVDEDEWIDGEAFIHHIETICAPVTQSRQVRLTFSSLTPDLRWRGPISKTLVLLVSALQCLLESQRLGPDAELNVACRRMEGRLQFKLSYQGSSPVTTPTSSLYASHRFEHSYVRDIIARVGAQLKWESHARGLSLLIELTLGHEAGGEGLAPIELKSEIENSKDNSYR